jgi:hypothetical protein
MNEVFNAAQTPITGIYFGVFAVVPLVWSYFDKGFSGWFVVAIVFTCLLMSAIPLWDQLRVRDMIATGKDLKVTRGIITNEWHIESWRYKRDHIGVFTTISEGFDVGDQRFSWNVGQSYSPVTFTNQNDPPVKFTKGMLVEVTWFSDATSENERRIVKLALAKQVTTNQSALPGNPIIDTSPFGIFRRQFSQALFSGDKTLAQNLTRLPFLLAGHKIDADRFDDLWTGLFTPYNIQCLAEAQSQLESDGSQSIICGATIFIFRNDKTGNWRFEEIGVND